MRQKTRRYDEVSGDIFAGSLRTDCGLVRLHRSSSIPDTAARYIEAIVSYCESLSTFPLRGTQSYDIQPGLRVTNYKKRRVIAFDVDEVQVSIIGIFYGGQDYETILQSDADDCSTH